MLRIAFSTLLLFLAFVPPAIAQEATPPAAATKSRSLAIGDPAPPIDIATWVKGDPITGLERGRVYVVEFLATWDENSVQAVPFFSDLQRRFSDKGVTIIGVFSADGGPESADFGAAVVRGFVDKQGEAYAYTAAVDRDHATDKAYMGAFGTTTRPQAFLVSKDGRIAWVGQPHEGLERVLARAVDGSLDVDKEAAAAKHKAAIAERSRPLVIKARQQITGGDLAGACTTIDEITSLDPVVMGHWSFYRFQLQAIDMNEEAKAYGIIKSAVDNALWDNAEVLNAVAWLIVDPNSNLNMRDNELALKAAVRANDLTDNNQPELLDTLAACHAAKGDFAKALEIQEKALLLIPANSQVKTDLEARRDMYKRRVGK